MRRKTIIFLIFVICFTVGSLLFFQIQMLSKSKEQAEEHFNTVVRKLLFEISFKYELIGNDRLASTINLLLLDSLTRAIFEYGKIDGPIHYGIFNMDDQLIFTNDSAALFSKQTNYVTQFRQNGVSPNYYFYKAVIPSEPEYIKKQSKGITWISICFSTFIILSFILSIIALLRQSRLSNLKADFISNMTHEFKTPIATMDLIVDSIQNPKVINDPEKLGVYSKILKEEIKRLNTHLQKILEAGLLEKNDFDLKMEKFDAIELVDKTIKSAKHQAKKVGGNISFNSSCQRIIVKLDPIHFQNILFNLFDNAIKYSGDKPSIDVLIHSDKVLRIQISDKGPGIQKQHRKKIFEKLYRIPNTKSNIPGSGIGLYYVHKMTNWMGGNIHFEPIVPNGSRFILSFPIVKEDTNG